MVPLRIRMPGFGRAAAPVPSQRRPPVTTRSPARVATDATRDQQLAPVRHTDALAAADAPTDTLQPIEQFGVTQLVSAHHITRQGHGRRRQLANIERCGERCVGLGVPADRRVVPLGHSRPHHHGPGGQIPQPLTTIGDDDRSDPDEPAGGDDVDDRQRRSGRGVAESDGASPFGHDPKSQRELADRSTGHHRLEDRRIHEQGHEDRHDRDRDHQPEGR